MDGKYHMMPYSGNVPSNRRKFTFRRQVDIMKGCHGFLTVGRQVGYAQDEGLPVVLCLICIFPTVIYMYMYMYIYIYIYIVVHLLNIGIYE
jgi:hypothetical protein